MKKIITIASLVLAVVLGFITPNTVRADQPVAVASLLGNQDRIEALQDDLNTCRERKQLLQQELDATKEELQGEKAGRTDAVWDRLEAEASLIKRAEAAEAKVALLEAELTLEPTRRQLALWTQRQELEGKFATQLQKALEAQQAELEKKADEEKRNALNAQKAELEAEHGAKLAAAKGEATDTINTLRETIGRRVAMIGRLHDQNVILSFQNGCLMVASLFLLCSILWMRHRERNTSTGNGVSTTKDDEQSQDRMASAHHLSALQALCDRETARAAAAEESEARIFDSLVQTLVENDDLKTEIQAAKSDRSIEVQRAGEVWAEVQEIRQQAKEAIHVLAEAWSEMLNENSRQRRELEVEQFRLANSLAKGFFTLTSAVNNGGRVINAADGEDVTSDVLDRLTNELAFARARVMDVPPSPARGAKVRTIRTPHLAWLPNLSAASRDVAPDSAATKFRSNESPSTEMVASA